MTPQQIVGFAARLFAIWLVITAIEALGMATAMAHQPGATSTFAPYGFAGLFLVAAIFLWLFPMVVAHRLVPRTRFEDTVRVPAHDLLLVACIVLGLWVIVVRAVPALAYYISLATFWLKNGQAIATLDQSQHLGFLVGLIHLAIGLFLVLRARQVTAYLLPQPPNGE
jgi:hypothetical protein